MKLQTVIDGLTRIANAPNTPENPEVAIFIDGFGEPEALVYVLVDIEEDLLLTKYGVKLIKDGDVYILFGDAKYGEGL